MAGEINKSGAAAMDRAVAELGRSRQQVYTLAELLAPAQTALDMSLTWTCHLHLSMQFISCPRPIAGDRLYKYTRRKNNRGPNSRPKLTAVHLPWRLRQRQLRTSLTAVEFRAFLSAAALSSEKK